METAGWSTSLTLGDELVDREHRHLFEVLNRLVDAMRRGTAQSDAPAILDELTVYARDHFAHEEEWMRRVSFPDLARHSLEHQKMAAQVSFLVRGFSAGRVGVTEILAFVDRWLRHHIREEDARIAKYARTRSSGPRRAIGS